MNRRRSKKRKWVEEEIVKWEEKKETDLAELKSDDEEELPDEKSCPVEVDVNQIYSTAFQVYSLPDVFERRERAAWDSIIDYNLQRHFSNVMAATMQKCQIEKPAFSFTTHSPSSDPQVLTLLNSASLAYNFAAINLKFDRLYSKRAYVWSFVNYGLEEGEMVEA